MIVHYGDYPPAVRGSLRHRAAGATELREVAAFDDDVVYEIAAPAP